MSKNEHCLATERITSSGVYTVVPMTAIGNTKSWSILPPASDPSTRSHEIQAFVRLEQQTAKYQSNVRLNNFQDIGRCKALGCQMWPPFLLRSFLSGDRRCFTSFSSSASHFMTIFPNAYSLSCWRASICMFGFSLCLCCRFIRSQRGDSHDLWYY